MRKYIFLLSILALSYITGFSQTETNTIKNRLEFSTGYNSGSLKNLEFAPVSRYDYNAVVYKLNYERKTKNKNLFEIQLDYLSSQLNTSLSSELSANYSKTALGFSYLKQVYNKDVFSIHVGLQSQTSESLYLDKFYFVYDQEFGIASRFTYKVNKKQYLTSKLTIPVVLLRHTKPSTDAHSLNRYQSASWNLEYGYSLSNNFDIKLNYDFKYNRLQILDAFRELQHQLNLGINYKF